MLIDKPEGVNRVPSLYCRKQAPDLPTWIMYDKNVSYIIKVTVTAYTRDIETIQHIICSLVSSTFISIVAANLLRYQYRLNLFRE